MKIRYFLFMTPFLTCQPVFSQKLYTWCPKDQLVTPRLGFLEGEKIDLVIFDGRALTKNSKIECTSAETVKDLGEFIKMTYPSANIDLLDTKEYYKDPKPNKLTIKVGIVAYHAAFGADVKVGIGSIGGQFAWGAFPQGEWNAVTGYNAMIYDYRNSKENKVTRGIAKIASRPNTGGYRTAKNILNKTYIEANQDLLFFIDNTLMK